MSKFSGDTTTAATGNETSNENSSKPKESNDFYDIIGRIIAMGVRVIGVIPYAIATVFDNFIGQDKPGIKVLGGILLIGGVVLSADAFFQMFGGKPLFPFFEEPGSWIGTGWLWVWTKVNFWAAVVVSIAVMWIESYAIRGKNLGQARRDYESIKHHTVPEKNMEGGIATQRHPLEDQIEYLSEAEKNEALLVNYRFGEIASILNSAPPKVRFDLYRHLCGQFHARRDIITLDEVKHYISSAVSEARRSFVIPNTPGIELLQAPIAELPVTATTSLTEQGGTEALATRMAAAQVEAQNITVNFFDFTRLRTEPDKFAHLRVIGGTGIGKTTFVDWLKANRFRAAW